jgi:hypothetical protein
MNITITITIITTFTITITIIVTITAAEKVQQDGGMQLPSTAKAYSNKVCSKTATPL